MNPEFKQATGPYRLRDLKNGTYQIHSKRYGAFEGPLNPIFHTAIKWGVNPSDLQYAIKDLKDSGNDYAEFGLFGGFLYSLKNKQQVG